MSKPKHSEVKSRNDAFVERTRTRIWEEAPSATNPYIAEHCRCHGYDLLELMQKRSFVDVLFLLFRGELPSTEQAGLLEQLMIALINPGPRHPATRAAMNAGVGKTEAVHILPISLSILGGTYQGAGRVEAAMRSVRKHARKEPQVVLDGLIESGAIDDSVDEIAPGFGSRFGGVDRMPKQIAQLLLEHPGSGKCLAWGHQFALALAEHNMGWHLHGVAAAVFTDLGFQPRMGGGLFQMMSAPGLFAQGIELANKPTTAMPFVKDEDYVIET